MITIGIDPGIEKVGVGIVENCRPGLKLIDSTLIKTSSKLSTPERLELIFSGLTTILDLYPVTDAAVEQLFFAKNTKTAMTVAQARGVILLALQLKGLKVHEYTPLQVKQALIGYGRADKKQIQQLVKVILKLDTIPKQDDVADGIAIAITHINTYKTLSKIRQYR